VEEVFEIPSLVSILFSSYPQRSIAHHKFLNSFKLLWSYVVQVELSIPLESTTLQEVGETGTIFGQLLWIELRQKFFVTSRIKTDRRFQVLLRWNSENEFGLNLESISLIFYEQFLFANILLLKKLQKPNYSNVTLFGCFFA
jgi:hypothetical protein